MIRCNFPPIPIFIVLRRRRQNGHNLCSQFLWTSLLSQAKVLSLTLLYEKVRMFALENSSAFSPNREIEMKWCFLLTMFPRFIARQNTGLINFLFLIKIRVQLPGCDSPLFPYMQVVLGVWPLCVFHWLVSPIVSPLWKTIPISILASICPTKELVWCLVSPRKRRYGGESHESQLLIGPICAVLIDVATRQLSHICLSFIGIVQLRCDCQTLEIENLFHFRNWLFATRMANLLQSLLFKSN